MTTSSVESPALGPAFLIGIEALDDAMRAEARAYLLQVMEQRGFPLNVASLWNALHFGWDLREKGYRSGGSGLLSAMPNLADADEVDSLPVGALCVVSRGNAEIWAELVYLERRMEFDDPRDVPPEFSGAPAIEGDAAEQGLVEERWVLDLHAFGSGLEPSDNKVRRLRRKGVLDTRLHRCVSVRTTKDTAETDDLTRYASWLLANQREALEQGPLGEWMGPDATDELWLEALFVSFGVIADLLSDLSEVRMWCGYAFLTESYNRAIASHDTGPSGDDLSFVYAGVRRHNDQPVRYSALGPLLRELEGSEERLRGTGYPAAVCYANSYIVDRLEIDAPSGLDEEHQHLRVDDASVEGGIWRVERIADGSTPPETSPRVALHLGYLDSRGVELGLMDDDGADQEIGEDAEIPEMAEIDTSQVDFTLTLKPTDLESGRLTLGDRLAEQVSRVPEGVGPLGLRLRHAGQAPTPSLTWQRVDLDDSGRHLVGVKWPSDFFPGIRLYGCLGIGATVIELRTALASEPRDVGGRTYWHEGAFRDLKKAQDVEAAREHVRTSGLRDLIVRAFRRRGEPLPTGGFRAREHVLAAELFGQTYQRTLSLALAIGLNELREEGRVSLDGEAWIYTPSVDRSTRASDREALRLGAGLPGGVRQHVAAEVRLHLREMPEDHRPSQEKVEEYRRLRPFLDPEGIGLPDIEGTNWTVVRPHTRGGK